MDKIYRNLTLDEIPWNVEIPPENLRNLVKSGWVKPCDAIDLGCGVGNFAIWFASIGFRMTGLELSQGAIEIAISLAAKKSMECRFVIGDMTSGIEGLEDTFDFAYDWEVLHHVFPENRAKYVKNVHRMLRSKGKYYSLCFSEEEPPSFGGDGKYRKTRIGTTLYFSSEQELKELFEPYFQIEQLRTVEVHGKKSSHMAVEAKMLKMDI